MTTLNQIFIFLLVVWLLCFTLDVKNSTKGQDFPFIGFASILSLLAGVGYLLRVTSFR